MYYMQAALIVYLVKTSTNKIVTILYDVSQFCNEFAVPKDKLEHFKKVTPQDIVCSQVLQTHSIKMSLSLDDTQNNSQVTSDSENCTRYTKRGRCCCVQCQN